jgi:CheY-like chemotaxis protein
MIVEDDIRIRLPIAEYLREVGFVVIEAASGAEAVGVVRSGSRVDVVFSDVQMPGPIDGLGLASWLIESGFAGHVVLTSGSDASRIGRGVKFFPKPYKLCDVCAYLASLFPDA